MDFFAATTSNLITPHILSFLEGKQILILFTVSRHWHNCVTSFQTEAKWESSCKSELQIEYKPPKWSWKKTYGLSYKLGHAAKPLCPHLKDVDIDFLKKKKATIPNKCQVAGCVPSQIPNDPWFCTFKDCTFVGCSRSHRKHAFEHAEQNNHPVSQRLSLNIGPEFVGFVYDHPYCYICDRYMIAGDDTPTPVEGQLIGEMRKALCKKDLYMQSASDQKLA